MRYRILTETRNNLERLVSERFDGGNLYTGIGLWRGTTEPCTAIDLDDVGVLDTGQFRHDVYALARSIKVVNKQEAVLVQEFAAKSQLI